MAAHVLQQLRPGHAAPIPGSPPPSWGRLPPGCPPTRATRGEKGGCTPPLRAQACISTPEQLISAKHKTTAPSPASACGDTPPPAERGVREVKLPQHACMCVGGGAGSSDNSGPPRVKVQPWGVDEDSNCSSPSSQNAPPVTLKSLNPQIHEEFFGLPALPCGLSQTKWWWAVGAQMEKKTHRQPVKEIERRGFGNGL
jgi:hypothetical protein